MLLYSYNQHTFQPSWGRYLIRKSVETVLSCVFFSTVHICFWRKHLSFAYEKTQNMTSAVKAWCNFYRENKKRVSHTRNRRFRQLILKNVISHKLSYRFTCNLVFILEIGASWLAMVSHCTGAWVENDTRRARRNQYTHELRISLCKNAYTTPSVSTWARIAMCITHTRSRERCHNGKIAVDMSALQCVSFG